MHAEQIRELALGLGAVEECTPFGPDNLVYKIAGKMFMLMSIDDMPISINLKCDPDRSVELRAAHSYIIPGNHMNKKHWNTITMEYDADERLVRELIHHSFSLVAPKKKIAK